MNGTRTLFQIGAAARLLDVPQTWLRAEALAGRIPCLKAGGRILVHLPTVEQLLVERASPLRAETLQQREDTRGA